jgi:hypothetical protein
VSVKLKCNAMSPIFYRYYRGAVFGLMLLLAGAANMVCFSYDADNDEDTPPVTIELHVVAPERGHSAQARAVSHSSRSATYHLSDNTPVLDPLAWLERRSAARLSENSPQLVVPLRR